MISDFELKKQLKSGISQNTKHLLNYWLLRIQNLKKIKKEVANWLE